MSEAIDKYKAHAQQLLVNPDNAEALADQFAHLSDQGTRRNARYFYPLAKRAYELSPNDIRIVFNYGTACQRSGRFNDALEVYRRAVETCPPEWKARCWHHLGLAYRALGKNIKSIECYDEAIRIDPERKEYLKDRALALCAAGQLKEGLKGFEIRRDIAEDKFVRNGQKLIQQQRLPADLTFWKDEDIKGKLMLVYHEEGVGDFIMVSRFLPRLKAMGCEILLTGNDRSLLDMIADNMPVEGVVDLNEIPTSEIDYVVGSMTVPWRVGVDYGNFDGKPYLKAREAGFPKRGKLNVGLVWSGNPAYSMDAHRSMTFSELTALFDMPEVAFYSLQMREPAMEVTTLGFDGFVADLSQFCTSWRKTASLVAHLDVIVTVDTAIAHLAGALGIPVLMMITNACDWRWNRDSEKTVWYDSMRVYRQEKQDDWRPVIERVKLKLQEMLRGRRQDASHDRERPQGRRTIEKQRISGSVRGRQAGIDEQVGAVQGQQ